MTLSTVLAVLPSLLGGGIHEDESKSTALVREPLQDATETALDWKDLTRSGIPIKFYGFLRLDSYFNSARMNNIILPVTVSPEDGTAAREDDAGFAFDPRLTRFGFDVTPAKIGEVQLSGKLETDFANFPAGVAESRPTPRIRVAYIDIAGAEYGLRVGQDWDVISPIFPAVNHETVMWNAGNTGDRRAQIQGRWMPTGSHFQLKAAFGLTGAITNEDLDAGVGGLTPERDGFDSGLPHLQARAGYMFDGFVEKKPIDIGAWGAVGRTETDSSFDGERRFDTSIVGADAQVPITDSVSARGEVWTGENLGDFRGGIGQTINTGTGEEIAAMGGWAELVFTASARSKFHVGASIDDPDDEDIPTAKPERNFVAYAGTVYDWASGLRTGFDVLHWETDWKDTDDGAALRLNLYFQYNF